MKNLLTGWETSGQEGKAIGKREKQLRRDKNSREQKTGKRQRNRREEGKIETKRGNWK